MEKFSKTSLAPTSKEARGQRLKQLRGLTGSKNQKPLSRATIERKYELSSHTLRHWEESTSGLTEKGARIVVDIYQRENINCSVSWLMTGKGNKPYRRKSVKTENLPHEITNVDETIQAECQHFKSLHPEAIVLEVKDDAMSPLYQPSDTVGGLRHYFNDIPELIGKDCIIETKDGNILLR